MIRITHPRPEEGAQKYLGVDFRDGVAEVDELHPERRLALIQHGFGVDETADLRAHTVPELRELAAEQNVQVSPKARKGEIVAAIVDAQHPLIAPGEALPGTEAGAETESAAGVGAGGD